MTRCRCRRTWNCTRLWSKPLGFLVINGGLLVSLGVPLYGIIGSDPSEKTRGTTFCPFSAIRSTVLATCPPIILKNAFKKYNRTASHKNHNLSSIFWSKRQTPVVGLFQTAGIRRGTWKQWLSACTCLPRPVPWSHQGPSRLSQCPSQWCRWS